MLDIIKTRFYLNMELIKLNGGFMLNANIFQDETRKITYESLLRYIQDNNIEDINIMKTLLEKCIDGCIEDINKHQKELSPLI